MAPRVAVIGAGIIGLTSAVLAVEHVQQDVEFTLISETFSPYTTGDGSAGFWQPYLLGEVPEDVLRYWCEESVAFFRDIYKSPQASDYGVNLISCFTVSPTPVVPPLYRDLFVHWREMTEKELSLFPSHYKHGAYITTYLVECKKFLPMLMNRFRNKGGKIIEKKVDSLDELCGAYDVVINCTGVGAAQMVPDPLVKAIRGQVMNVKAPWINHAVTSSDGYYIFPHCESVVCGGTSQMDNWSVLVDPEDRQTIWKGCTELVPSLQKAEIVSEWVGLRPGRSKPRLERETLKTEKGDLEVIHNYGHGGSGVTLAWGCAHHTFRLLREILEQTIAL